MATPLPNRPQKIQPKKRFLPVVPPKEAAGVLIIAVLILAFTLARYWHNIAWSAR
ncbi:MAG TPA: hypothetical protein VFA74_10020 [Terriglobales bacterium]|nr:hypothetical protein [Terriglobales bacterium]